MADVEAEEPTTNESRNVSRATRRSYIRGVREDRPAVISVNIVFSLLLWFRNSWQRLHPFRNQPNASYATVRGNLLEPFLCHGT